MWLASRMARLGRVVVEALILHYGRDELLRRLADPFWFQSLGCVMGMDWHSSGITTSVMGALKRGLAPVQKDLGLFICGGRGRHSQQTPDELIQVSNAVGLDGDALARTSRLVAKVDSAAVQDGFSLYLHSFVLASDGSWAVVQQGMNTQRRQARRYHWLSSGLQSFVEAPHTAIEGENQGQILNLTDRRAREARQQQLELVHRGPEPALDAVRSLRRLQMPAHHDVRFSDVMLRRLHATLTAAADAPDFESLLLTPGLGARTVQALALVGEVIHGAPSRFDDPARFSFAHGGKDGDPFPVPLTVYDQTLTVLRRAVEQARLGNDEKLHALRRLDQQARLAEHGLRSVGADREAGLPLAAIVHRERGRSASLGGRTVHDDRAEAPARHGRSVRRQLTLPGLEQPRTR